MRTRSSRRPYVAQLVVHRDCLADPRRLSGLSYSQIAQQIGISEQRVVDSAFSSLSVVRSSQADVVISPSPPHLYLSCYYHLSLHFFL